MPKVTVMTADRPANHAADSPVWVARRTVKRWLRDSSSRAMLSGRRTFSRATLLRLQTP
jgi:hypothetical protein